MKLFGLCVIFFQIQVGLLMAEQEHQASTTQRSVRQTDLWNPEKPHKQFEVQGLIKYQRLQATKTLGNPPLKAPRCSRLKESCAPKSHSHCCDPCASCRCRFFNTVCHCWRLSQPCQRST